jgi:ABC-type glycerol-3-phosphate transport system substrate-binding protein
MDKFVFDGACEPLDDYIARDDFDVNVFYTSYVKHVTMGGKYYGIGWAIDSSVVFFNKDLFDEKGVAHPPRSGEWDWDGYRETAIAMTDRKDDGSFETVGSTLWLNMNTDLPVDSLYSNGGRQINDDEDFSKTLIGEPEAREAIHFAMDLFLEDKVVQASNPEHSNPWIEEFNSGRYALHWGFSNNTTNFAEAPFQYDIVPLPVSPKTGIRKSSSNPNSYTMMAKAKEKDGAWDFLQWLANGEDEMGPQVVWCRDIKSLVPHASVNFDYWQKDAEEETGFYRQAALDSFADHWRYPHFPAYADWYIPLGEELSQIFQGKEKDAAIDDAVKRGDEILAENPTPEGWVTF